ncbi:MAG TPA: peptidylprolyl isomerase [Bacteroidetes bacterium]|nr:peptidylprolyl isomerase [Bacteroidota bacterium]
MKKIYLLTVLLCSLVVINSCKKDGDDNPPANEPKYEVVELTTKYGKMYIWLYDDTPLHKANFLKLCKEGFYDSTTFHRTEPGFVIQGGDPNSKDANPNNDGYGGPGYTVGAEIKHSNVAGTLGGASTSPGAPSNGSQFYINQVDNSSKLDGSYTVFGQVIKGNDQITTIVSQPFDAKKRPLTNVYMFMAVKSYATKGEVLAEYGFAIPD